MDPTSMKKDENEEQPSTDYSPSVEIAEAGGSFKKMDITEHSFEPTQCGGSQTQDIFKKGGGGKWLRHHELIINEQALNRSLWALRLGVFCDAVNITVLQPNFPFMAYPGSHPDSFESTGPFDFNAATYFLPMTALLGTAIASTAIGYLSDRQGRRPWILACLFVGVIGSIAKYLLRKSFWGFCAANFVNGIFGASLSVAMAYVSDVKSTRAEKDAEIGNMVALNMMGMTGGGICAILMGTNSLFSPLFIGAALNLIAGVFAAVCLIEPKKMLHLLTATDPVQKEIEELEDSRAPTSMSWPLVCNVLAGALADNFGSAGLMPMAMSPLAFNTFLTDFEDLGEEPIMSQEAYKWIATLVALMVIPGAAISQKVFDKVGPAGGCVFGNFFTGCATIVILYIVLIDPPSNLTFGIFIAVLYLAFPLTVLSQLSTGPMLDALSPVEKRGFTQGLNISVMAGANAASPFILGILADSIGTKTTIWICIGISFAAAAINAPLMFAKALKRLPPLEPEYARAISGEDNEIIEKALRGEWVPLQLLNQINGERFDKGRHFVVPPIRPFDEDKDELLKLRQQAERDFEFKRGTLQTLLQDSDTEEKKKAILDQLEKVRAPEENRQELKEDLGKWFTDYLEDSGYWMDESPQLWKQMIMKAFPPVMQPGDTELTPENFEQVMVSYAQVLSKFMADRDQTNFNRAFAMRFGHGAARVYPSYTSSGAATPGDRKTRNFANSGTSC